MDESIAVTSDKYKRVISFLNDNGHLVNEELPNRKELVEFMREYEYDHSPWPFVITKSLADEFHRVGVRLLELSYKAILQYFGRDSEKFSTYFNVPALFYDLIAHHFNDVAMLIFRHDFLISGNAVKLVEMNVGSDVGGWELDWMEQSYRERLNRFFPKMGEELNHNNALDEFLSEALNKARELKPSKSEYNILAFADDYYKGLFVALESRFDEILKAQGLNGNLIFSEDLNDLRVNDQNITYFLGKEMDVIYIVSKPLKYASSALLMQLTSCAMAGNLYFPDSPVCTFMGNKKIQAFLHETKDFLSADDQAFINRHIPVSLGMDSKQVKCAVDGKYIDDKEKWVIKKAMSMQGKDVFIGRTTPRQEWKDIFHKYMGNGDWILQEFCLSDEFKIASKTRGLIDHHCIWGAFYSNARYISNFVRAIPSTGGTGIINSAKGACEVCVFEESYLQHSLTL